MHILTVDHEIMATVSFVDKRQFPALIDDTPIWESSNPDVVAIIPTDSPYSVIVRSMGKLGTSQITVRADADLSEGEKFIITTADIEVVGGEAVGGTLSFGESTPVPAPEPEPEPIIEEPAPAEPVAEPVTETETPAPADPAPAEPVTETETPAPAEPVTETETPADPAPEEPTPTT